MMIKKKGIRCVSGGKRGSLLLTAFFVLAVLTGVSAAFMMMVTQELRTTERQRLSTDALYIAEAGIQRGFYDLTLDLDKDADGYSWMDGEINGIPVSFPPAPDCFTCYRMLRTDVPFFDGAYTVAVQRVRDNAVWLKSVGTVRGVSASAEAYVKMNPSPWNNAIFAGTGGGNTKVINGNVDVRGSVTILGQESAAGDFVATLSGGAKIVGNNYEPMPANLLSRVPLLEKTFYNGEWVEMLEATLRVKYGKIKLDGTSSVGEQNVGGNSYKETADGVYVNDGFGGNQQTPLVYADEQGLYDMGDALQFPKLSDPYAPYNTYQDFLEDTGYVLTEDEVNLLNTLGNEPFSITSPDGNHSIVWDGSSRMDVNGILYINGSLNWAKATVEYSGTASFLVTGGVNLKGDILAVNSDGSAEASFPQSILGIMTPQSMVLEGGPQGGIMGVFYSQDEIEIKKQTRVVGSIVSDYFNMGNQVPKIFHVPSVADHLPPGMINVKMGNRKCRIMGWVRSAELSWDSIVCP